MHCILVGGGRMMDVVGGLVLGGILACGIRYAAYHVARVFGCRVLGWVLANAGCCWWHTCIQCGRRGRVSFHAHYPCGTSMRLAAAAVNTTGEGRGTAQRHRAVREADMQLVLGSRGFAFTVLFRVSSKSTYTHVSEHVLTLFQGIHCGFV